MASESQQITVRVDARLLDRADALTEHVAGLTGGAATRADVWRQAIIKGLQVLEREQGAKRSK